MAVASRGTPAILLTAALAAGTLSCGGCQRVRPSSEQEPPPDAPREFPWAGAAEARDALVPLCDVHPKDRSEVSFRFLLDASASMAGFEAAGSLASLQTWLAHSASRLETFGVHLQRRSEASFSQRIGIRERATIGAVVFAGDTNLSDAVLDASQSDLALILTDGVPFQRTGTGEGDCAQGADFGCVVRRIGEHVERFPEGGFWVVPLVTRFQGSVYLEGQSLPPGLESATVRDEVRKQFPQWTVTIDLGRNPTAVKFEYRGPKVILALVLARDASLGRAFVRLLLEQAPLQQIHAIGELVGGESVLQEGGTAVLPPIEVMPGFEPPMLVRKPEAKNSGVADEEWGPIDLEWVSGPGGRSGVLKASCGPSDLAWALVRLELGPRTNPPSCRQALSSLPAVQLRLDVDPQWVGPKHQFGGFLGGGRVLPAEAETGVRPLELLLTCNSGDHPAGTEALDAPLMLSAALDYGEALKMLDDGKRRTAQFVDSLHTDDVSAKPHRVMGFKALLRGVLQRASTIARAMPVAALQVRYSPRPVAAR